MKKLPIGIADFRYMIEENYLYIDKTKYLHMLKDRGKFYFHVTAETVWKESDDIHV